MASRGDIVFLETESGPAGLTPGLFNAAVPALEIGRLPWGNNKGREGKHECIQDQAVPHFPATGCCGEGKSRLSEP